MKTKNIFGRVIQYIRKEIDGDTIGEYDDVAGKIYIEKYLKGLELKQVQLHEEFHAVWARICLDQAKVPDEIEEVIVDSFSKWVVENYTIIEKRKKEA